MGCVRTVFASRTERRSRKYTAVAARDPNATKKPESSHPAFWVARNTPTRLARGTYRDGDFETSKNACAQGKGYFFGCADGGKIPFSRKYCAAAA